MALFRVDFSGRGELSERQQKAGVSKFASSGKTHYNVASTSGHDDSW
jgi:hypothetical protein